MRKIFFSLLFIANALGSFAQAGVPEGDYYIQTFNNLQISSSTADSRFFTSRVGTNNASSVFTIKLIPGLFRTYQIMLKGTNLLASAPQDGDYDRRKIFGYPLYEKYQQRWQFFPRVDPKTHVVGFTIRSTYNGREIAIYAASTHLSSDLVLNDQPGGWNQLFQLQALIPAGRYYFRTTINNLQLAGSFKDEPMYTSSVGGNNSALMEVINTGDDKSSSFIKCLLMGQYAYAYSINDGTYVKCGTLDGKDYQKWQFLVSPVGPINGYEFYGYKIRNVLTGKEIAIQAASPKAGNDLVSNTQTSILWNQVFKIVVPDPASFTLQPRDVSIAIGDNNTLECKVKDARTYQWQKSSDGVSDWTNINDHTYNPDNALVAGFASGSLTVFPTTALNFPAFFRLSAVSDQTGMLIYSNPAKVTVAGNIIFVAQATAQNAYVGQTSFIYATLTPYAKSSVWEWYFNPMPKLNEFGGWRDVYNSWNEYGTLSGERSSKIAITPSNLGWNGRVFRLRVTTLDNRTFYSNEVKLNITVRSSGRINENANINLMDFSAPKSIFLYPNPANSSVTVTNLAGASTISLLDALGNTLTVVKTNNASETINISKFANGMYNIRIASVVDGITNIKVLPLIKVNR